MKKKDSNSDLSNKDKVAIFPEIELQYAVSEEEVWENLVLRMDEIRPRTRRLSPNIFFRMALAASVLFLIGVTGFLRLYTKTVSTPAGQHLTFSLPDSSVIELNAQSVVKFHPYWFGFARTITLDGEAFFKVIHGNQFKVKSLKGEITVLGTTFNIYSRDNNYSVTCFTGKVRVESTEKSERVLLNPHEQAFITNEGFLRFVQESNSQVVKSWRDNMFVFTGSPIVTVLQEIERQYNIKIHFKADPNLTYTGNFSKSLSEKEVLDLVCTSMGLTFEARSGTEFLIE